MRGQFLLMLASGLVGKDEIFTKLQAFLWRSPKMFGQQMEMGMGHGTRLSHVFISSKKYKTISSDP